MSIYSVSFAIIVVVAAVLAAADDANASRRFGRRGCNCPEALRR